MRDSEELIDKLIREIKGTSDLRKINIPHPVVLPKQVQINHNSSSTTSLRNSLQNTPPRTNFDICKQ